MVHLRLHDIDWEAGVVRVPVMKTGVARIIPLPAKVGEVLRHYIKRLVTVHAFGRERGNLSRAAAQEELAGMSDGVLLQTKTPVWGLSLRTDAA